MSLDAPVTDLSGVGEALAGKLARLRIEQVADLLFHLPLRYQDRTRITPIGTLRAGTEAVVEGEVSAAEVVRGRRRSLLVRLKDGTGILSLRFFHFSPAQQQQFVKGVQVRCFGEARAGSKTQQKQKEEKEKKKKLNDLCKEKKAKNKRKIKKKERG